VEDTAVGDEMFVALGAVVAVTSVEVALDSVVGLLVAASVAATRTAVAASVAGDVPMNICEIAVGVVADALPLIPQKS